jgi:hypothetical protein
VSAGEDRNFERVRLHEMMAVSAAESTVASARMAELKAAQDLAWRRHNAAKGLVTRARKDGSTEKLSAAVARELLIGKVTLRRFASVFRERPGKTQIRSD